MVFPPATRKVIGIDLGTASSCAALWKDGKVEIIPNKQGHRTTPSYITVGEKGTKVGDEARQEVMSNSTNMILDSKKLLGKSIKDKDIQCYKHNWPFNLKELNEKLIMEFKANDNEFILLPEEVISLILTSTKNSVDKYTDSFIEEVVLTIPNYFNSLQKEAILKASDLAGLKVIDLLPEPVAAIIGHGIFNQSSTERLVLVYDFGASSFDASIINVSKGEFKLITTNSTKFGGNDFDIKLTQSFAQKFKKKIGYNISNISDVSIRLRVHSERIKRMLSTESSVSMKIKSLYEGCDFFASITRTEFEMICNDLFLEIFVCLENLFDNTTFSKNDIDDIIMTGGSAHISKIQTIMSEYFDKQIKKTMNPEEVIANGAAIHAAILSGNYLESTKYITFFNITKSRLGIETANKKMHVVIPKNSLVPFIKTKAFSTSIDNQTDITFSLYEGESNFTIYNNLIQKFNLINLPALPQGQLKIYLTFDLNILGQLKITASYSNIKKDIIIDYGVSRLNSKINLQLNGTF